MIRILDIFSGVGGFVDASIRTGYDVTHVALCEVDSNCQNILRQKYPTTLVYHDIRTFDTTGMDFDVLVGGFPCQPFSRNGRHYNKNNKTVPTSDIRSNLFLEIVRVLKTNKPKAFLLENVKELLTIKNEDGESFLQVILSELIAVGYTVNYSVLSPTQFNDPQQRKRVFLVGFRNDIYGGFEFPKGDTLKRSVRDILEISTDPRLVLETAWKNRRLKTNPSISRFEALVVDYNSRLPHSIDAQAVNPLAIIYGDTPSGLPRQQDKLYSIDGISPTIATFSTPAFNVPEGWRILTPRECFRLQGFDDSHPIPNNLAQAYKQAGNAVNVNTAKAILERVFQEITRTK